MTNLSCAETKRQVQEFLQQELTENEMDEIMAHLANCASCEGDFLFEQFVNKAIVRSCEEDPPQELAQRIAASIRQARKDPHFTGE